MNRQAGFTLIELMIVVAIIAILLVIAIPAYQDYTIRTRVSEGLSLASVAKLVVTEQRMTEGDWPVDNAAAGYESPATRFVQGIQIDGANVEITLTNDTALGGAGGGLITLTAQALAGVGNGAPIEWSCSSAIPSKYLPSECRP
jgi:type IV pilus assembly protein PilA